MLDIHNLCRPFCSVFGRTTKLASGFEHNMQSGKSPALSLFTSLAILTPIDSREKNSRVYQDLITSNPPAHQLNSPQNLGMRIKASACWRPKCHNHFCVGLWTWTGWGYLVVIFSKRTTSNLCLLLVHI